MKLLGAGLILSVSLWFGVRACTELYRHSRALESMISALELLRAETASRLTPLSETCGMLARSMQNPAGEFFANIGAGFSQLGEKSFSQIWSEAVSSSESLCLTTSETDALTELGAGLGKFCAEEQDAILERTLDSLKRAYAESEETRKRNSKLYVSGSAAVGMLAVIMLI